MANAGISTFEGYDVTHIKIFNNCTFFERRPFCYVMSLSTPTGAGVTAFLFFEYVIHNLHTISYYLWFIILNSNGLSNGCARQ
jgi:hypothetical protein